jgi:uncharacterized protein (TIGR02284 family)
MATKATEVANHLDHLIHICRDGAEGFSAAADKLEGSTLRPMLRELGAERQTFANELQAEVVRLGQEPATDGTTVGTVHRGWMSLREAISSNGEAAVIIECERGEDAAVDAYEETLRSELTPETRIIVARQAVAVKASHDRVRAQEKKFEKAKV